MSSEHQDWFLVSVSPKRLATVLTVVSLFVGLWITMGTEILGAAGVATREYHDQDVERIEGVMWCMYYQVDQVDCPYSPPDRPPFRYLRERTPPPGEQPQIP